MWWVGLALALVVSSCAGTDPETVATPTSAAMTSTSSTTSTASTTTSQTAPTTTTLPPLPDLDLSDQLVWYGPNMGSVDFVQLFSRPNAWARARETIDVFKFYGNAVSGFPFDIGGDNVLDTFIEAGAFEKLGDWDVAISLESGVVKFFACKAKSWAEYANLGIANIEANGGRVSYISMDEPLLGGQLVENDQTCGYTMEETAKVVARFMELVHREHPDVLIGTIETIPPQTADEVGEWLVALERAGAKPAYLHLDVEVALGIDDPQFVAELADLTELAEDRGIPVGFIMTADLAAADSDEGYYRSVLEWSESLAARIGRPSHLIFQSWIGPAASGLHEIPLNLPDDDSETFSHTRLILDALEVFD